MANLDLYGFISSPFSLVVGFAVSSGAFGGEPGGEEGGWVEVGLEVTDYLRRGDGGGFVDCLMSR